MLNDTYFYGINWEVKKSTDIAEIITFSGTSNVGNVLFEIDFFVQQGAKFPLACIMKTSGSSAKNNAQIEPQKLINEGLDGDSALISADASISVMLAMLADM